MRKERSPPRARDHHTILIRKEYYALTNYSLKFNYLIKVMIPLEVQNVGERKALKMLMKL